MRPAAPLLVAALALAFVAGTHYDGLPLRGAPLFVAAWGLALLVASIYAGLARTSWRRALGMALMLTPVAFTAWSILNDLGPLIAGGRTITARSHYQLSSIYMRSIMTNVGYVGAGFLLWSGWRGEGLSWVAARLREAGLPMGRRSEASSLRLGVAWFPVLLFGAIGIDFLVRGTALVNNDETSIWSLVTPWHVIMISLAAAVGEEIVYRGVILVGLAKVLGDRPWSWWTAIVLQAVFFGFAHAGFGNYAHVLQATLFGLVSGFAAYRFGIWAPLALHFLVDIYAIGAFATAPGWGTLLSVLLLANVLFAIYAGVRWATTKWAQPA